jgi:cobalt-zinc-cadmium efflux system membrane fusion protein
MLTDTSTVWIQGHIFDRDLPLVQVGQSVDETNPALAKTFHGTVSYIGVFVDAATRTTPVRIVTQNSDGLLKKDMFVDAVIHSNKQNNVLALPVSAILHDAQNEPIVYVLTDPGKFTQRSVKVGAQQRDMVEVTFGLRDGDEVVSDGSLFLQFANTSQ